MNHVSALCLLALAACATPPKPASFPQAQSIIDQAAAKHPDVVRLTLHASAGGESRSRVVASNVPAKLDDWSDPEDTEAIRTGKTTTLKEGRNLDYTAPVMDASGRAIAAIGVTVGGADKMSEAQQLAKAKAVAAEVSSAILAAGKPLW